MSKITTMRKSIIKHMFALLFAFLTVVGAGTPAILAQNIGASGLPLPRFASLGSSKINVRVGPGQKYDVAWIFVQNGLPIEIIQEFDPWRKIRDSQGSEGWIHKTLLSGNRTALVTPWLDENVTGTPIYARPDADAPRRAILQPKVLVSVDSCDDNWCKVTGRYKPDANQERSENFSGWINQVALWGVYQNEKVK